MHNKWRILYLHAHLVTYFAVAHVLTEDGAEGALRGGLEGATAPAPRSPAALVASRGDRLLPRRQHVRRRARPLQRPVQVGHVPQAGQLAQEDGRHAVRVLQGLLLHVAPSAEAVHVRRRR